MAKEKGETWVLRQATKEVEGTRAEEGGCQEVVAMAALDHATAREAAMEVDAAPAAARLVEAGPEAVMAEAVMAEGAQVAAATAAVETVKAGAAATMEVAAARSASPQEPRAAPAEEVATVAAATAAATTAAEGSEAVSATAGRAAAVVVVAGAAAMEDRSVLGVVSRETHWRTFPPPRGHHSTRSNQICSSAVTLSPRTDSQPHMPLSHRRIQSPLRHRRHMPEGACRITRTVGRLQLAHTER